MELPGDQAPRDPSRRGAQGSTETRLCQPNPAGRLEAHPRTPGLCGRVRKWPWLGRRRRIERRQPMIEQGIRGVKLIAINTTPRH